MNQNLSTARLAAEVATTDAVIDELDHDATTADQDAAAPLNAGQQRRTLLRARAAVVVTALVVLVVVLLLPIAAISLAQQLRATDLAPAYSMLTGQALDPDRQNIAPLDA